MISLFLAVIAGSSVNFTTGGNPEMDYHLNSLILLAAPCYRNKPDITTVLKGRLTFMQTLLCKIVICLKIPHLHLIETVILPEQQVHQ